MKTFNNHHKEMKWRASQWKKFHTSCYKSKKAWHRATLKYLRYMWTHDYDEVDRNISGDFKKWVESSFEFLCTF